MPSSICDAVLGLQWSRSGNRYCERIVVNVLDGDQRAPE